MKNIIIIISSILVFSACSEPINLKLKSSDSKLVIEAKYSSLTPGMYALITKNATYFGNDSIQGINDADVIVTIGDTTVHLHNLKSGLYVIPLSSKYLYKTYTMSVVANGKTYEATSTMPQPVKIDSVKINQSEGIMARRDQNIKDTTTNYTVNVYFKDPIGTNYYKIILYKNGKRLTDNPYSEEQVFDDLFFKPNTSINMQLVINCMGSEKITAELMSIDKAAYDYYMSLLTTMQAAGGSFSVPENPLSNFSNDALGFFSAYGSDTLSAIVPMPKKK